MSTSRLKELLESFASLPEGQLLPEDVSELRSAFDSLSPEGRHAFLAVSAQLLADESTVRRLADSPASRDAASLLATAVRAAELRAAADELQANLLGGVVDENTYQVWCEQHSWVFGNRYVLRDTRRRIDATAIADLLLPSLVGYRDIIELKRPDASVLAWDR